MCPRERERQTDRESCTDTDAEREMRERERHRERCTERDAQRMDLLQAALYAHPHTHWACVLQCSIVGLCSVLDLRHPTCSVVGLPPVYSPRTASSA